MVTIVSIRNSPFPGSFLSNWMTVTFAILAAQPRCMALNFEAVLRLKPICAHGWIAWITSVSPPLPSHGFTNTWLLPNFYGLLHHLTRGFRLPSHLQALAAAHLKRWSGLPHPANVTILHTGSSKRAGLRITHLATFLEADAGCALGHFATILWQSLLPPVWQTSAPPGTVVASVCTSGWACMRHWQS